MKKIVFTGGGTVGHVTLNLLLIPKFIANGWEVHYIGDRKGIEYEQLEKSGLPVHFHSIATGKLRRYFSWQNLWDVFKVAWGTLQSFFYLLKIHPQVLFSKGGFVSVPPVMAAKVLGIPVYIHESDLTMGLANKIAYKFSKRLFSTFQLEGDYSRVEHVGAISKLEKGHHQLSNEMQEMAAELFDPAKQTLLFIGGSGGAKVFNDFVDQNRQALLERYNLINLTGDKKLEESSPGLYRLAFARETYRDLMELADIVITRGGSNTLFELVALEKLHVIVPLGKEASRGDQLENAAYFEKKGYAPTIQEPDLTLDRLETTIGQLQEQAEAFQDAMAQSVDLISLDAFYQVLMREIEKGGR
ncbi:UDP-N-acetylglucosamine--N-acetylmuramyl-(pentapeptide) pyrophosphoryl-undecaprenol N-acetylglucosamine transferase [Streptococcus danieliae]|uniref:UDP-N-acetylglucosamine--N-acetylmuramyl-(pentapeptide) pyrophosphoryl-undecaprenol N-acetylglucosamine transferase n=1 Tax=Streptococcus danieliae TaxID=747656 RepID=A0A7Z0M5P2_9STRE|nr:UDP-N-acetylglucosamine--N-acetylmuramyl-(pentapeptide) pyrophosphoryl-undecaprenol N-acetylglucosamine transferase [Streptococcus danieliae]MBF0699086.1 UDP-N-acetylglucosamine--N-acetylmuramyl-(pentapeptide) pyrophosphoryl-undecaprenol N-acetylglucosamine transferase [Streptococcus danieliae]NYS96263.1 UDP-N-acetylglucosamine--N-acetylmuramyl-(pentapeptide) pyrophosphoryl-undecaprenol N-acetylglucosamine transferase [Streptococcus danieliae]